MGGVSGEAETKEEETFLETLRYVTLTQIQVLVVVIIDQVQPGIAYNALQKGTVCMVQP